jgi:hypothetical protein
MGLRWFVIIERVFLHAHKIVVLNLVTGAGDTKRAYTTKVYW